MNIQAVRESKQEAKYVIPYHYLYTENSVTGTLYFSYLSMAAECVRARNPKRVLDAGCGDARFTAYLRHQDSTVTVEGLDYSETAIAFARIYNPDCTFTCASVEHMPFADGTFDVLALIEVIEHFEPAKLADILKECSRVLKPSGALVITTPSVREHKMSKAHYQHFTEESIKEYLHAAGLKPESIQGNYRYSRVQILLQGILLNRFFEIRHRAVLRWYNRIFSKKWARCSPSEGRRLITVAVRNA
jgi:ubiquinone/menaquinone biosynthesis C-methylase UbiE